MPGIPALDLTFGASALEALQRIAPTWVLGVEEDRAAPALAKSLRGIGKDIPPLAAVARDMTLWNWQRRPLSLESLIPLQDMERNASFLPPALPRLLRVLRQALSRPLDAEPLRAAMDAGEQALTLKHLLMRVRQPGEGAFWLAVCWDWLLRLGREDLPPSMLEASDLGRDLPSLAARLRAEWAALYLPPEQALAYAENLDRSHWGLFADYLRSELHSRLGDHHESARLLARVWRRMPWHPNLTLKLSGLLEQPSPTDSRDLSDTCVLVYSWNKADLLEDTLRSLAASDMGQALVVALDNGSNDDTPQAMARCKNLFAKNSFLDVRLPVNVGAPAARNWLLSLPEVRSCRRAAFLDDDVVLPRDWLTRLSATMDATNAAVVGCRIVAATPPAGLQSADYHLLPPRDGIKTFRDVEENILVFDNCAGALDIGLYSYCRPALSVSGCCHLLSMAGVEKAGAFDIRFSPTQFDDLERDLRVAKAGLHTVYEGRLAIGHVQHSSLAKAQSLKSVGHVFGNKIKLEGKYTKEEIETLSAQNLGRLWQDLEARRSALLQGLPPTA